MEQEIFSTIQRNQNATICNDDLFTYEYLDSKQEDICFEDGCLVSTDYLTYLTFENVRFELNQPIKSFEYFNNLLALIYADNSGEVFTLEKKTVKKFQDVSQILMHSDKIYTLEKDYTVKEYLFNLEQSICKESLSSTLEAMSISKENKEVPSNETNKVLFQEKKQILLTIFKNTLFYFKDNNLYNKEQKKITNSVKKIKELKNDKLLVITEQNNKINLKLTNIYFKLQEEVRIEEDSDKIVEVKLFEDYFVIATFYKIYIFKDNLELIDIKDFNKKIKSIYVHNFRIKILFGEEKKKEKIKKSKNERYFAMPEEPGLENNNYKCQVEMLTKIVDKLVNTFNEERKEREDKERKRMESLLEKISEQLNLNLKLIIENSVKKEIQKISFKNLENSLCHFFKEFILENMVPVFENSITEMKIQQKEKCEKCSNNLYESFKRDEVTKGVELALESNEEIFDEFISKFDVAKIEILPINLLIELYKKILMGKNDLCIPTRNKIFKKIKNQKEFLKGLNEDIILLIPSTHLLKLITLIHTDNEYLDLLEEIVRYIDINTLNDHEIKDFSRILDDIEKEWKGTKVGHYCIMQRGFIKRRSKKEK